MLIDDVSSFQILVQRGYVSTVPMTSDHTDMMSNDSNATWYDGEDGPSLHTRLAFAGTWMLIAVAGILGRERPLSIRSPSLVDSCVG